MKKVLFQFRTLTGNYYLLDGDSNMYSENQILDLVHQGKVSCSLLADGTIDTNGLVVVRNDSPDDEDVVDESLDIDLNLITVCDKIRRLAKLNRIRLDSSEHTSNNKLNTNLLNYIEYCGMTPLDYIKNYLCNLQPYMILRLRSEEYRDKIICVLDNIYRVSVYIKVDTTQFHEVIVSFHESNKRGVAKTNSLISKSSINDKVFVFANNITSKSGDKYGVTIFIQRGVLVLPVTLVGKKFRSGFIVNKRDIDNYFLDYCNDYIKDLYTSDLDLNFNDIEIFSVLQQISFTSYGRDTFSSVSLLIDSLVTQNDMISKRVAAFALDEFVSSLMLTVEQKQELIGLLEEKFRVTSIRGISTILTRVYDVLLQGNIQE